MWHFQSCYLKEGKSFHCRWISELTFHFFPIPFLFFHLLQLFKAFHILQEIFKNTDQICPFQHWHRNNFPNLWLRRQPRDIPNFISKWVDYLLITQAPQGRGLHKCVCGTPNPCSKGNERSCKLSCYSEQEQRDHGWSPFCIIKGSECCRQELRVDIKTREVIWFWLKCVCSETNIERNI